MFNRLIYGNLMPLRDSADDGGSGSASTEDSSDSNNGTLNFDDFLKDEKNRSEFDRRVTRALETAKSRWEAEKATELDNVKKEAEKLAKMNAEQRAEHERQKKEADLAEREKKVAVAEMRMAARDELAKRGIPVDLAEVLIYEDADKCKASIDAVEKAFQASVEKAVNDKLRGTPPKAGGGNEGTGDATLRAAMGLK